MRSWKPRWLRYAHRIDAMSLRERAMVFVAVAAIMLVAINSLLLEPLARHDRSQLALMKSNDEKSAANLARIQALITSWRVDPDAELRARLVLLRDQSNRAGKTLTEIQGSLVPPQRMTALLEDILRRNRGLRLVALKTLPATGLVEPDPIIAGKPVVVAPKPLAPAAVVYKHGVELTVSGSYAELVHYLNELEGMPWHMFWGKADLSVEQYPKSNLTLRLYTLSLDPAWLAL